MSDKFYTPDEVARKVLEKTHELVRAEIEKAEKSKHDKCSEQVEEKAEVDKCGDMKVMKDETKNPLKDFLDKKKAKKAGKMEKMLGMNQAAPAPQAGSQTPSTSTPSIASQIGWPGTKK